MYNYIKCLSKSNGHLQ